MVWATLDRSLGRAAIKSFVVPKGTPGMTVERLEHKLGIRASDTAAIRFEDCRVPAENLLGSPDDRHAKQGFAGAMATFDNTRPLVAAMAVGCARASLDLTRELLEQAGVEVDYDRSGARPSPPRPPEFLQMEADWEGALPAHPAGRVDGRQPASRTRSRPRWPRRRPAGSAPTSPSAASSCAGTVGYSERELLEKWARDSKILDIFEGTQQIQQLIVARRMLGPVERRAQVAAHG